MEHILNSLSGIERVKYLKGLIEKVNNISTKKPAATQPATESQICSACAVKTKRFLLANPHNSNKIELRSAKPISQKCDVHRLKFLRHDSPSSALNVSKRAVKSHPPSSDSKTVEVARDASFEAEKRCLRKIYAREAAIDEPEPANVDIGKGCQNEIRAAVCRIHSAKDTNGSVPQRRPVDVRPQQTESALSSIVVGRNRKLIGDGRVASRNRNVAVSGQLSSDPVITVGSDGTRRIAGQSCAHCQHAIADVAFFDGNRQLCAECADSHFRRVTTARFTNRPMSYREYKVVGGDSL